MSRRNQGYYRADSDMQQHRANRLLNVICGVLGWNYFWFREEPAGRRRLFIGDTGAVDGRRLVL